MAGLDFLFQNNAPADYLAPTTSETSLPAWFQSATRGLITDASAIAGEPYAPYGGPRVAGLTDLQNQALGNASTAGQAGAANMAQGANLAAQAGNTQFNQNDFNQFLSPYTQGAANRIAQLGQQDLTQNILPSINNSFIGSGMPFGSRHADVTSQALNNSQQNILGQQAQLVNNDYNNAMTNYQGALQRQAQTGGILSGIGSAQTQNDMQTGGYQNLMGGVQQANQQTNLDTAYQDFLNQKQYPLQQLDTVNSILKGYSPYQSITKDSTTGSALPAAQTSNAGIGALSALGSFFNGKA